MTHPSTNGACRASKASVYRISKKKHTTVLHLKDVSNNRVVGLGTPHKPTDEDASSNENTVLPARLDRKLWYTEWWSRQYIG